MMCVDAADGAEEVLGQAGVEAKMVKKIKNPQEIQKKKQNL